MCSTNTFYIALQYVDYKGNKLVGNAGKNVNCGVLYLESSCS